MAQLTAYRHARAALTATAVAVSLGGPAAALAASPAGGVAISPAPGTPDASPQTQISILGVRPGLIRSVRASGATSGLHAGRLRAYSRGRGASFVPLKPFVQGERVAVVVRIRGRAPSRFSFTIAHLGAVQPFLNLPNRQPAKLQQFVSRPDLAPPRISVLKRSSGLSGDVFLTPLPSPIVHPGSTNVVTISPVGPGGPMIIDSGGKLVWFEQLAPPAVATNLRLQRYGRRTVLTWWQGPVTPAAFGLGEGVIADSSYRTIRTVHAGNGYAMDLHEFELTPERDALFTVYSPILVHLPGTPAGTLSPLLDAIVQEVDIATGLVVWEWHAYGHIPLADSHATPANSSSYDAFHINSIQALSKGRVLVSARDTSAIYEIERAGGRIVVDAGRQGEQLPARARRPLQLPARRADAAERGHQHVRRRGRPADEGALLARSGAQARPAPPPRGAGAPVPAARGHLRPERGQHADAPRRQRVRRLRRAAVLLGVLVEGPDAVRREPAAGRRQLPRLPLPLEGHTQDPARRGGAPQRPHRGVGLRELERRHGRGALAGAGRPERDLARARFLGRPRATSRRAST